MFAKSSIDSEKAIQLKLELEEIVNNIKKSRIKFSITNLKMFVNQKKSII